MSRHSVRSLGRGAALAGALVVLAASCTDGADEDAAGAGTTTPRVSEPEQAGRASTTTSAPDCPPGGRTVSVDGVDVHRFCGEAGARIRLGDETVRFGGGECSRHTDWLTVNIGAEVVDAGAEAASVEPRLRTFSLLLGPHPAAPEDTPPVADDGAVNEGVIAFSVPGESYAVDDKTVTLVGTRTAGTFSGTAYAASKADEGVEIEGEFTCDRRALPLDEVQGLVETGADEEALGRRHLHGSRRR